jgi:hypothetical protein
MRRLPGVPVSQAVQAAGLRRPAKVLRCPDHNPLRAHRGRHRRDAEVTG